MKWILYFVFTMSDPATFKYAHDNIYAGYGMVKMEDQDSIKLYIIPDSPHHYVWIENKRFEIWKKKKN